MTVAAPCLGRASTWQMGVFRRLSEAYRQVVLLPARAAGGVLGIASAVFGTCAFVIWALVLGIVRLFEKFAGSLLR